MNGRTIVITGSSSGIGYALAELYLKNGDQVYGLARRTVGPSGLEAISCDLLSAESRAASVDALLSKGRVPEHLVLNAGFGIAGPVECNSLDEVRRQFEIIYFANIDLIQRFLPSMREAAKRSGRSSKILFISSAAAIFPIPYQAHYSAAKAAIASLARALSFELKDSGIEVSALLPGDLSTGFTAQRQKTESPALKYYPNYLRSIERMERDELGGKDASWLAAQAYHRLNRPMRKTWRIPGASYKSLYLLEKILPLRLVDYLLKKIYA
ncbi:MAG: SDR family NAD(P)-dependent oxidoreductase [Eubacteriales bacterium]|nr:SDR family NAD(P)-dependent oxidoreductase [Eubacteriales bacterium]